VFATGQQSGGINFSGAPLTMTSAAEPLSAASSHAFSACGSRSAEDLG
jgi:hypothetical protein